VGDTPEDRELLLPNSVVALARGRLMLARKPGSRVAPRDLAVFIVSVALWSLREMDAVDFSVSNSVRWLPFSSLMVGLRNTQVAEECIEKELLNQVRMILSGRRYRPDHKVKVRELVREWLIDSAALSPTFGDPYREVLQLAFIRAKTASLDPGRLDTAALRLASSWQIFLRHEPEIARRLQATVSSAIYSAAERDDGE